MSDTTETTVIRPGVEGDTALILDSWLKELSHHFPFKHIPQLVYRRHQVAKIKALLARSQVLILADAADPSVILGYIVWEGAGPDTVLHWLYIKYTFRGFGLAKQLATAAIPHIGQSYVTITHLPGPLQGTPTGSVLARRKFVFDPYRIGENE